MIPEKIELHRGCGELKFGLTRDDVVKLLGQPNEIDNEYISEYGSYYEYYDLNIDLAFMEEDDFRLGTITFKDDRYLLGNDHFIGMTEDQLVEALKKNGFDSLEKDDELTEEDMTGYYSEELGLIIYLTDGIVSEISITVDLNDEGAPIWPE